MDREAENGDTENGDTENGDTENEHVLDGSRHPLLASWRSASAAGPWPGADQWWAPAVVALVDALGDGPVHLRAAAEELGRQRAAAGVYLDQARADVEVAASIAGLGPAGCAHLVDALTLGWVDRTLDRCFTSGCVDPLTELATMPYLMTRLAEIYAEADFEEGGPPSGHALAVVRTAITGEPVESETYLITIGVAMRRAFRGGETLARIAPNCAVAVARRGIRFPAALTQLRSDLDLAQLERRLPGTQVWFEALPPRLAEVPALLRELASRTA